MSSKQGTITLHEGTSSKTGKTFVALQLTVGKWTELYFPKTRFEMDYIKSFLSELEAPNSLTPSGGSASSQSNNVNVKRT